MRLFVIKTSVIYMTVEDKSGVDQDMMISRAVMFDYSLQIN